ncbi:MAG: hypothetical protein QOD98_368 [Nocardioidaceae bacterium]|nr:hypothetical protein [Nocardioidaceae bacterium]
MRTRLRILGGAVVTLVAAAAVPLLTSSHADAARFTIDNLVVYRVGSGATLTNAAAPVFLDEYTQAGGAPVQTIALPTGPSDGNAALTASGLSRSEGLISRSADGKYLAITGYDAGVGATGPAGASLTASAPGTVARVVGLVDANGIVDTSTALTAAGAPKIIRSALTDGDRIWATGGNGGILTTTLGSGSSSTVAGTAASNFSSLTAQSGQLFASGILANRVTKVGSGFPTSAGTTFTDAPGLPTTLLAYGYAFFDLTADGWAGTNLDTLYLANASNKGGTLDKYRYNGSTWTLAQSKDVAGISGLVASLNTGNVSIAATTPTELVKVLDTGAAGTATLGTPATLASAPAGTEFRGVALAPTGTPGPSAYVRSPATGKTVNISSSGVPVSVYAKSPSGAVTGVTLTIGTSTVNATKGSGDVWSGTIPNAGLTAGAATLTVAATGPGGTTSVTRSITLDGTPPSTNPPPTTVPADALAAGKYAPSDAKVTKKGKWKAYKSTSSPTKKGLTSAKKGSTLTAKVYGSQLVLTFDKSSKSGQVSVTIDGKKTVIDLYNAKPKAFAKKFKLAGALASHTVVIAVLGTRNTKSTGVVVSLASLEVK